LLSCKDKLLGLHLELRHAHRQSKSFAAKFMPCLAFALIDFDFALDELSISPPLCATYREDT